MIKKKAYRILSLTLFLFGIFFLLNSQTGIIGAVIGVSAVLSKASFIGGLALILGSVILFAMAQRRYTLDDIVKETKSEFLIIDTNFLIENFGKDNKKIRDYIIDKINKGYNVVIPPELKREAGLEGIKGYSDFSESSDYKTIKKEAEDAIKHTAKYEQGVEFENKLAGLKNLSEIPRTLIGIARSAINSLKDKGMLPENAEQAKERIKEWVKKHYTNLETDSAILASGIYGGRQHRVLLISSDSHLSEALQLLTDKHPELRKRIDYRYPKDYNLVA